MAQVSLYGDPIPNEIHVDDHSDTSDNESQREEIRKALEDLGEESFDFDIGSESSQNESRSSSVNLNNNQTSFQSNKDTSQVSVNGNGDVMVNGSFGQNKNVMQNGLNLNMLPNSVMEFTQNMMYPNPMSMNGGIQNPTQATNGHGRVNGNLVNGNGTGGSILLQGNSGTRPKKQVTIVEGSQKNREDEEIEESNPTISLLHKNHCPRNDTVDGNGDWFDSSGNRDEQLTRMLQLRERQIERAEEEIQKLQKDKRSLNHQIGMMKTEMVRMKSEQDEADKLTHVKEQECEYLRMKLQETITVYEQVKGGEITAKDEVTRLNVEMEKLRQEIVLLSNIGQSTQKAEVNDIVRQLREKHSAEYLEWRKVVASLEGELRTYKLQEVNRAIGGLMWNMGSFIFQRKLQLQKEDSFIGETVQDACCQTDEVRSPTKTSPNGEHHRKKESTQFAIKDREDGDLLLREKKIISLNEKFEELKEQFEDEKAQIVSSYEEEIEQYRQRLASLPNELYRLWENTQRELGLQAFQESRPVSVDAFTAMDPEDDIDNGYPKPKSVSWNLQDAEVQVDSPTSPVFREETSPMDRLHPLNPFSTSTPSAKDTSSILVQTDEREMSNAVIQTEETLETYRILAQLLESWSVEVQTSKANEEESATRCREFEAAFNKLKKQFKLLQKVASKCRQESKKKEETFKHQIGEMKVHHMEVLQKLQEKLDVLS